MPGKKYPAGGKKAMKMKMMKKKMGTKAYNKKYK